MTTDSGETIHVKRGLVNWQYVFNTHRYYFRCGNCQGNNVYTGINATYDSPVHCSWCGAFNHHPDNYDDYLRATGRLSDTMPRPATTHDTGDDRSDDSGVRRPVLSESTGVDDPTDDIDNLRRQLATAYADGFDHGVRVGRTINR